jgi:hypothetical protein
MEVYNTSYWGKASGNFTADFYDAKKGLLQEVIMRHLIKISEKARTADGGKTWELIAENQGFGYASCVQYVPHSNGKSLVSVGASGLYYSYGGNTWKQLLIRVCLPFDFRQSYCNAAGKIK